MKLHSLLLLFVIACSSESGTTGETDSEIAASDGSEADSSGAQAASDVAAGEAAGEADEAPAVPTPAGQANTDGAMPPVEGSASAGPGAGTGQAEPRDPAPDENQLPAASGPGGAAQSSPPAAGEPQGGPQVSAPVAGGGAESGDAAAEATVDPDFGIETQPEEAGAEPPDQPSDGGSSAEPGPLVTNASTEGCRGPDQEGCAVCCQGEQQGRCAQLSAGSDSNWYNVSSALDGACPADCQPCAACLDRDESNLRTVECQPECDCDTVQVGIDPCFGIGGCECYCSRLNELGAACPHVDVCQ